jgi:predicted ABC-type ATPase
MTAGKRIVIIAGPNGAGKTTFAKEYLPNEADCPVFVNADLIASGLSPFAPGASALRAGRLMLEEINGHVRAGRSFAFETTLSGRLYARLIPAWQQRGYRVKLVYLKLASVDLALARVAARVQSGGHAVPAEVVERRFGASWRNFQRVYKALVDASVLYDNSGETPTLTEREIRR